MNHNDKAWRLRVGFDSIRTHRPWVKPWVRVERGAFAVRARREFGQKVDSEAHSRPADGPPVDFKAKRASRPVQTPVRPSRAQIAHFGPGCEK